MTTEITTTADLNQKLDLVAAPTSGPALTSLKAADFIDWVQAQSKQLGKRAKIGYAGDHDGHVVEQWLRDVTGEYVTVSTMGIVTYGGVDYEMPQGWMDFLMLFCECGCKPDRDCPSITKEMRAGESFEVTAGQTLKALAYLKPETALVLVDEPEPTPPATETTTRESLIAAVTPIPATFRTNYQRIGYMLSVLRSHSDPTIAAAAKSLYDGSISCMARRKATSTPEAVVAAVLARAEAEIAAAFRPFPEETAEAWARSLDPVGLPLALFPDAPSALELVTQRARREYPSRQQLLDEEPEPPTPSSPASAPRPQAEEMAEATGLALYDAWESQMAAAAFAGWQDFERNRESIMAWADWRLCEMTDWEDSDERAEYEAMAA